MKWHKNSMFLPMFIKWAQGKTQTCKVIKYKIRLASDSGWKKKKDHDKSIWTEESNSSPLFMIGFPQCFKPLLFWEFYNQTLQFINSVDHCLPWFTS